MSDNGYVLDTNAIVALLQGSTQLIQKLQQTIWIGISIISLVQQMRLQMNINANHRLHSWHKDRKTSLYVAPADIALVSIDQNVIPTVFHAR